MDNKSDTKGASGKTEGLFGAVEMKPNGADGGADFEAFADSRGDLKPKMEMPAELVDNDSAAEVAGEMQPVDHQPVATPAKDDAADDDEKKDKEAKERLSSIKVSGNAGTLPAAYEKAVKDILNRNRKDPFRLVRELDIARWDLMEKAFSRKLGDGLNGQGAK